MVTGEIKSQIDRIWNDFWTGGIFGCGRAENLITIDVLGQHRPPPEYLFVIQPVPAR